MAHLREPILARLLVLAKGLQGIRAADRNVTDVINLQRPAMVIKDGSETPVTVPRNERRTSVQMMSMAPGFTIYVGAGNKDAGPLTNTFLARYLKAVLEDAELLSLVGTNGEIRYEGSDLVEPEPEGREARMEISLVIVYPFNASAL